MTNEQIRFWIIVALAAILGFLIGRRIWQWAARADTHHHTRRKGDYRPRIKP